MSFSWHEFVSETGAELSSPTVFPHVLRANETIVNNGNVLLVNHTPIQNQKDDSKWWPAEVVLISGTMLLLKWCTPGNNETDSLMDMKTDNKHPCFWFNVDCSQMKRLRPITTSLNLIPPSCLNYNLSEICLITWNKSLYCKAVHPSFFSNKLYKYELYEPGRYLECTHELNPNRIWPVKVLRNHGGRLVLKWLDLNTDSTSHSSDARCFTLFYSSYRLHNIGYGKSTGLSYQPPLSNRECVDVKSDTNALLQNLPSAISPNCLPLLSKHFITPRYHNLREGWKMEVIDPENPFQTRPATILKVFNSQFFLVGIDSLSHSNSSNDKLSTRRFVSCAGSPELMPINTSLTRGIFLQPPSDWPTTFTWTKYLTHFITPKYERYLPNGFTHSSCNQSELTSFSSNQLPHCPDFQALNGFQTPADCLHPPTNNCDSDFVDSSLSGGSSLLSPETRRFLLGTKLEMVTPKAYLTSQAQQTNVRTTGLTSVLCCATVTRVDQLSGLVWLLPSIPSHLIPANQLPLRPVITSVMSIDLYPVGWANQNDYPLIPPDGYHNNDGGGLNASATFDGSSYGDSTKQVAKVPRSSIPRPCLSQCDSIASKLARIVEEPNCPVIYLNTSCYLGPYLNRTDVERLPSHFGPGPVTRVLQNLLSRLLSTSSKPSRLLRLFEADWANDLVSSSKATNGQQSRHEAINAMHQHRHSRMRLVLIRFRCRKGSRYEAPVEVASQARAVAEFCLQTSLGLEACPHFISLQSPARLGSPNHTSDQSQSIKECPSYCSVRRQSRHWESSNFATAFSTNGVAQLKRRMASSSTLVRGSRSDRILRTRFNPDFIQLDELTARITKKKAPLPSLPPGCKRRRGRPRLEEYIPSAKYHRSDHHYNQPLNNHLPIHTTPQSALDRLIETSSSPSSTLSPPANGGDLHHHYHNYNRPRNSSPPLDESPPDLVLTSNPLDWSAFDLGIYLSATDCSEMWPWLEAEGVDGQAFMLLTLPILHRVVGLEWDDAVRLVRHIAAVKQAFFDQYSTTAAASFFARE